MEAAVICLFACNKNLSEQVSYVTHFEVTLRETWEAINEISGISTQQLYRFFFNQSKKVY